MGSSVKLHSSVVIDQSRCIDSNTFTRLSHVIYHEAILARILQYADLEILFILDAFPSADMTLSVVPPNSSAPVIS